MMGIEQERNGGGGEWLLRRPGLRRLRVVGLGSPRSGGAHRPGRTCMRPLQGDDVVSMETGVCICRKASRLGSSHWFSPCIWQLKKMKKQEAEDKTETKRRERGAKVIQLEFLTSSVFDKLPH